MTDRSHLVPGSQCAPASPSRFRLVSDLWAARDAVARQPDDQHLRERLRIAQARFDALLADRRDQRHEVRA